MENLPDFWAMALGPMGGLFAVGVALGAGLMFLGQEKYVFRARVLSLQKVHTAEISALKAQVALLEEKSKKYDELMEGLANSQLAKLDEDE